MSLFLDIHAPRSPAPMRAPAFTPEQLRKLARIANRHTLYEAVIERKADGRRVLLAYVGARSKRGLMDAIHSRAVPLLAFLGAVGGAEIVAARGSLDLDIGDVGTVRFSGRTQRDAIIGGELPYTGNVEG